LTCPICGYRLTPYESGTGSTEYECRNNSCPRIITGKITNFLDKLGAVGISDQSVLDIYEKLKLRDIVEFLDTDKYRHDLIEMPSWGVQSANNFCDEIARLKSKPITHGEFLGAMGIPGISTKKCKTLFSNVSYDEFMKLCHQGKYDEADEPLYDVKGFSVKTLDTFMDFIKSNLSLIDKLSEMFTLVDDKKSEANVVFTGLRDKDAEEYLSRRGVDVSDNINAQTIAVISANKSSGKTKKAIDRGIAVFDAYSAPLTEICDYIVANLV
jgi:NAD-dependent DNA ligase